MSDTLPGLNVELLAELVTWAASDHIRGTDPEKAVELGLAKEGDKRLGRWNQNEWSQAERNGTCQTAYCIAGAAVALDQDSLIVMSEYLPGRWSGGHVVDRSQVSADLDVEWGHVWLKKGQCASDVFGDNYDYISERARHMIGLNSWEADSLFSGVNEIDDVISRAEGIARERGLSLDLPAWVTELVTDDDTEYVPF